MKLDELLPCPDFSERHERLIEASPEDTWRAVLSLSAGDATLTRLLMGIRSLPALLSGRRLLPDRDSSGTFLENGPIPLLSLTPEVAAVAGGVLQPWKLRGGDEAPKLDADELTGFDQPGWVKCGMDFNLEETEAGTRLVTETRITATDDQSRRRFGRYWLVVRPGSGMIRGEFLRIIARKAEGR